MQSIHFLLQSKRNEDSTGISDILHIFLDSSSSDKVINREMRASDGKWVETKKKKKNKDENYKLLYCLSLSLSISLSPIVCESIPLNAFVFYRKQCCLWLARLEADRPSDPPSVSSARGEGNWLVAAWQLQQPSLADKRSPAAPASATQY